MPLTGQNGAAVVHHPGVKFEGGALLATADSQGRRDAAAAQHPQSGQGPFQAGHRLGRGSDWPGRHRPRDLQAAAAVASSRTAGIGRHAGPAAAAAAAERTRAAKVPHAAELIPRLGRDAEPVDTLRKAARRNSALMSRPGSVQV